MTQETCVRICLTARDLFAYWEMSLVSKSNISLIESAEYAAQSLYVCQFTYPLSYDEMHYNGESTFKRELWIGSIALEKEQYSGPLSTYKVHTLLTRTGST